MIHGSLQQFPDAYFVFLTNNADTFRELVKGAQTPFEALRREEHYKIIDSDSISPETFSNELVQHLKTIPKRIMVPICRNETAEPYAAQYISIFYFFFNFYFLKIIYFTGDISLKIT